jgi:predicted nucleotidyltransferase
MFTVEDREKLRDTLVAAARADSRITGAALTGSAASGSEDEWSDIDLFLGLAVGADKAEVLADWTERLYAEGAVDHTDVRMRGTIYRVFLLANTLQVDIAFAPAQEFGALGPGFRVLFGEAVDQQGFSEPTAADLIGIGWLYALHARSSIVRGRLWQAQYMLNGLRDHVLMLACLRHNVPTSQGRGYHLLPPATTYPMEATVARAIDASELTRAFAAAVDVFLTEVEQADAVLAKRLSGPLRELAGV